MNRHALRDAVEAALVLERESRFIRVLSGDGINSEFVLKRAWTWRSQRYPAGTRVVCRLRWAYSNSFTLAIQNTDWHVIDITARAAAISGLELVEDHAGRKGE